MPKLLDQQLVDSQESSKNKYSQKKDDISIWHYIKTSLMQKSLERAVDRSCHREKQSDNPKFFAFISLRSTLIVSQSVP